MCTVTWVRGAAGFDLFANRDERLTRAPAQPPQVRVQGGVRYLAPTDTDAGGTWIGVNEHGLCLTVLNDDPGIGADASFRSRGWLVCELMGETSVAAVAARLSRDSTGLSAFRGFRLVVLTMDEEPRQFAWNRERLAIDGLGPSDLPLASSTHGDHERVLADRRAAWNELVLVPGGPDPARLRAFHASRLPTPGPTAVCMERPDAATVSGSWARVRADSVGLRYCPTPPCDGDFGPWLELERST